MPVSVSYPGVYIDEVPSGTRAIAGVPTSVAAFIGYSVRGPTDSPRQLFSFADFERTFGGLHLDSPLSYAVNHFFLNGGATAWVVRVAENAAEATVVLLDGTAAPTLAVSAASEGGWGNHLELVVDYDTANPGSTFNLTVNEVQEQSGRRVAVRSETHRNLSMNPDSANFVETAVNADSDLVQVQALGGSGPGQGNALSGLLTIADIANLGDRDRIAVSVDGGEVQEVILFPDGALHRQVPKTWSTH